MSNTKWNESIGAAIESASRDLPAGYVIRLMIEKDGYSVRLVLPDGTVADIDGESTIDEIKTLTDMALSHSQQPKPLTPEQLYFQRWAD